jgi:hypothetical protein
MFDGERGISHVLSVLLLVIVAFGVGILLYNFVMETMKNVTENPSAQPFRLLIENVAINDTCMTVYIRNSLNRDVTIDRVYMDNVPCDVLPSNSKLVIPKNSVEAVYIPGSYNRGALYEIKIIFTSGHTILHIERY